MTRSPLSASLASQHREPALTITPGMTGYRLAFAGGTTFEVLADNLSPSEAIALYRAAKAVTHQETARP